MTPKKVWLPQGVSEPAWGTRPLVRTPGWSRTQGVLKPPTRAQPGEPPLWSRFVYLGLGEWGCLPPRRNPRPAGLLLFIPQQPESNNDGPQVHRTSPIICFGASNIKMQVSGFARTSPFICFGAHQYPNSNNDGPQLDRTNPIICFGAQQHQNASIGWGNKQWGKHSIRPAIVVFLQRGAGAKKKLRFFCGSHFLRRAQSQKLIFFCVFFLRQNNTLDRELIVSANN